MNLTFLICAVLVVEGLYLTSIGSTHENNETLGFGVASLIAAVIVAIIAVLKGPNDR